MHNPIYYINGGCAMNKKLITIFLLAALLTVSVGFIYAADNDESQSISISINWNDNGHANARPESVVVNLIKDGNIIDNKTLNKENSWSATFNVDGDGSYSVSEDAPSNYSVSKSGSASSGFVITNTYKADVLSAKENETPLKVAEVDDKAVNNTETAELIGDENNTGENDTVIENNTDTNSSDENDTKTTEGGTVGNTTPPQYDEDTIDELEISSKIEKSKEIKKDVKKEDKEKKKPPKPKNVTQNNLRNTGIPAVILVVAVFVAAFIPYKRNK